MAHVAQGDRDAFARLYDATSPRVYGLVLRMLRDEGYAEETLQEVYLQVWQRARDYRTEMGSVLSWMLTIAHRRTVDRIRSEEAASSRERRYHSDHSVSPTDDVVDSVLAEESRREVDECLDTLTAFQRESIEMSYYRGLTYRQVAENVGAPLPTIKSRIRDGLRRLRACLESSHDA